MADSTEVKEFDPLAVENVGVTLAVELLAGEIHPMPPASAFYGAGVYALYYSGAHPSYQSLTELDAGRMRYPIYIGKAAGESAKQGFGTTQGQKRKLFERIIDHSRSIRDSENLDLGDFKCRFLVLNDAYISLAESVLIRVFRPAWNGLSFGSKVVGKNRMGGQVGLWDALHPGRSGRPAGTARAVAAAEIITSRINGLHDPIPEESVRRMYDRIMKFV